jgi:hypothetical protein
VSPSYRGVGETIPTTFTSEKLIASSTEPTVGIPGAVESWLCIVVTSVGGDQRRSTASTQLYLLPDADRSMGVFQLPPCTDQPHTQPERAVTAVSDEYGIVPCRLALKLYV